MFKLSSQISSKTNQYPRVFGYGLSKNNTVEADELGWDENQVLSPNLENVKVLMCDGVWGVDVWLQDGVCCGKCKLSQILRRFMGLSAFFSMAETSITMLWTWKGPGLNVISELIIGYLYPGKPLANVTFKIYSTISMGQALDFLSDFKLGHYMKIPPKSMFIAQIPGQPEPTPMSGLTR
ncbi:hypothetical protein Ddye_027894 [Dipteronia dyeriana]|uniref:Uncharacterized protein n=1 Tax=Dipteronia dyeriana TaxID=168575 RepID=A0AAD9TQX4_9ROSI|nr:hypothetical protein Ddye_027894 [Dipteronia dyeriana]